jgi:hypothetical protein
VSNLILNSAIINKIFTAVSGIFILGFLVMVWSAVFINQDMPLIARIIMPSASLLASYIVSPMSGVLKWLRLLTDRIEGINNLTKEI